MPEGLHGYNDTCNQVTARLALVKRSGLYLNSPLRPKMLQVVYITYIIWQ